MNTFTLKFKSIRLKNANGESPSRGSFLARFNFPSPNYIVYRKFTGGYVECKAYILDFMLISTSLLYIRNHSLRPPILRPPPPTRKDITK